MEYIVFDVTVGDASISFIFFVSYYFPRYLISRRRFPFQSYIYHPSTHYRIAVRSTSSPSLNHIQRSIFNCYLHATLSLPPRTPPRN